MGHWTLAAKRGPNYPSSMKPMTSKPLGETMRTRHHAGIRLSAALLAAAFLAAGAARSFAIEGEGSFDGGPDDVGPAFNALTEGLAPLDLSQLSNLSAGALSSALPGAALAASAAPAPIESKPVRRWAAPPPVQSGEYTLLTEPFSGRAAVLNLINNAQTSINLTIYEIEDPPTISALINAAQRGVTVRVIYNLYSFRGRDPNAKYIAQLQDAGVQTQAASRQFEVTHEKAITADGKSAVIMTFNLVPNYFSGTRDFGIVTANAAEVAEIDSVFNADWNGEPADPTLPELVWSPENSREKILSVINGATKTLEVYGEETEDPESMQALINAAQRGVAVRFITAVLSDRGGQDGNAAERQVLNDNGVQAKALNNPYIHAKVVLADYGTPSAQVFLGSENFSKTSLDKNRELGIILNNPPLMDSIESTFNADWAQ